MELLKPEHIKQLVKHFYAKVREDELLSPVFNDIAKIDWESHLVIINRFWNSIMLNSQEYRGNAFAKHMALNQKVPLTKAHFARWLALFSQTAQQYLPLDAAQKIILRATQIATAIENGIARDCTLQAIKNN